jgi:hypothetical protein
MENWMDLNFMSAPGNEEFGLCLYIGRSVEIPEPAADKFVAPLSTCDAVAGVPGPP